MQGLFVYSFKLKRNVMAVRLLSFTLILLIALVAAPVFAEEPLECKVCHSDKVEADNLHPALMMGCPACHANVDATNIPHDLGGTVRGLMMEPPDLCMMCHDSGMFSGKETVHMPVMAGMCITCHDPHGSAVPKLLRTNKPDLCYECHDKIGFYGPTVHEPVGLGMCNFCHEPHQSERSKLLKADVQDVCFNCHESDKFTGTSVHPPVAAGLCTDCHLPHASQNAALLQRKGNLLCRKCHAQVEKTPHAIMGFKSAGHPLRGRKDPKRSGKIFGCLSCHLPHASESPKLFRYKADSMFDLCTYCHEF